MSIKYYHSELAANSSHILGVIKSIAVFPIDENVLLLAEGISD